MRSLALFFLTLLFAAAPAQAAKPVEVPFELYNGRIYVSAFVNGKGPFRFAVDTGASGIGRADVRLTQELGLTRVDQAQNSDGVAATTSDVVAAESIRLGPITKANAQLISRDYNPRVKPGDRPLMGILARDFFADWLMAIDYPARTIRFSRSALDPRAAGVVHYGPSFAVPVCIGDVCSSGKVDTGSNRGLVLPKSMAEKVAASAPVLLGQAARTNSSVSLYEVVVAEPVRVGALAARVPKLLYAEPSTDTVNVGSEFLKDFVLTIDQQHQLLKIEKPQGR